MAMKDASKEPKEISSVSGGSITNAFLAYNFFSQRSNYRNNNFKGTQESKKDEDNWQQQTLRLFELIVSKGIVTKFWINFIIIFLILPPVLFVLLLSLSKLPVWYVSILIAVVWTFILLLRGLLIEFLISKRIFNKIFNKVNLKDLYNDKLKNRVEHVICCTDLVTGRPLYISTRNGGHIFRVTQDRPVGIGPRNILPPDEVPDISTQGLFYNAPQFSVAAAVRASAGFPGIPPRRISMNRFEGFPRDVGKAGDIRSLTFLSDGGIWNNLATQPYEDGFLWSAEGPWVVLVADASAPLEKKTAFKFHLPIIAEIGALVRQFVIQNINTVGPRRVHHHELISRELLAARSARFETERLYPLVSCMEKPEAVLDRLMKAVDREDHNDDFLIDSERERRLEYREKTKIRALDLNGEIDISKQTNVNKQVDPFAAENFRRLYDLAKVGEIVKNNNNIDPVASYPTTLGKIDRTIATSIVGRGYANTAITLYLTGLTDELVFPKGWLGKE
jgi:hypothetical protein